MSTHPVSIEAANFRRGFRRIAPNRSGSLEPAPWRLLQLGSSPRRQAKGREFLGFGRRHNYRVRGTTVLRFKSHTRNVSGCTSAVGLIACAAAYKDGARQGDPAPSERRSQKPRAGKRFGRVTIFLKKEIGPNRGGSFRLHFPA
ncbi:hypothetical protein F5X71_09870 [Nocardia brasiliensis]|uniref:Uncharacterized protein n=1 Tax=Nocardia brasiliensis TaxID=37326 RepID=A0A6G9XNU3_NOCBR|nr:hypothetical protein [Nocardia brasiliensis]QIS02585.1 hypothetical protein F5X71_09870 [Nocardia brasiliensis]